jgi:single-strand DNA-binding protein
MNQLRNRVQLIGNLGADPELREFDKGKKMVRFSVATNESYKNASGEVVKETQWHNVVAWNKTAEIADKYLNKGQEVCLSGKLSNRKYEDSEGVTHYVSEIVATEILLLGGAKS